MVLSVRHPVGANTSFLFLLFFFIPTPLLPPDAALRATYDALFAAGSAALRAGQATPDAYLQVPPHLDTRRGLTVLAAVRGPAAAAIAREQAALRTAEPDLYYYPSADLHVTIISLLTGRPGRAPDPVVSEAYAALLRELLADAPPLRLRFNGLTLTAEAILAQGYPDAAFQPLREAIRRGAGARGLPLDERYHSPTAHATIGRFAQVPRQPAALAGWVAARRELPLGAETSTELHLVAHDWYNRQGRSQRQARLPLLGGAAPA